MGKTFLAATAFLAPLTVLAHSGWAHSGWAHSRLARSGLARSVGARSSQESPEKRSASRPEKEKTAPERGYAAFYSQSLEGHKTACGGTYSSTQLTAAHRRLPCGTKLRVTNLRNGKTVRVTVNDHGPASGGELIIDLSYAAAQALGFVKQGTTLVKLEVIR